VDLKNVGAATQQEMGPLIAALDAYIKGLSASHARS